MNNETRADSSQNYTKIKPPPELKSMKLVPKKGKKEERQLVARN